MLSSLKPDEIAKAIRNGDENTLERIKGIGAKSAKRIILELREKISKTSSMETENFIPEYNNIESDALTALVSLGIARNTAYNVIKQVMKNQPVLTLEELIKQSLKNI
jgi:Holliday junction resolvasome, DNA-binding subunit